MQGPAGASHGTGHSKGLVAFAGAWDSPLDGSAICDPMFALTAGVVMKVVRYNARGDHRPKLLVGQNGISTVHQPSGNDGDACLWRFPSFM